MEQIRQKNWRENDKNGEEEERNEKMQMRIKLQWLGEKVCLKLYLFT